MEEIKGFFMFPRILRMDLGSSEKIVLSFIMSCGAGCRLTNRQIAKQLGMSKDAISRIISELERKGMVLRDIDQDSGNERNIFSIA